MKVPDSIKIHRLDEVPTEGFRYVYENGATSGPYAHDLYMEVGVGGNPVAWIYANALKQEEGSYGDEANEHCSVVLYCQNKPSPNHQEIKIPGGGSLFIRASPTVLSVDESLEQASGSSSETLLNAVPRPPTPREGEWWMCSLKGAVTQDQVLYYENGFFRHGKDSLERYINAIPLYKMDRVEEQ